MILSIKRITKALIRLCICAGWSAPLLFANHRRQGFSRRSPYISPKISIRLQCIRVSRKTIELHVCDTYSILWCFVFQIRKPMVEKRRRDRMNNSLEQLKSLLAVNIKQTVSWLIFQHNNEHMVLYGRIGQR